MADLPPLSEELPWPADLAPFQPNDRGIQRDPYAHYAWMREHAPVLRTRVGDADVWFVSRYDDVLEGLRDHETFSSQVIDPRELPFLMVIDPPEHTRLRQAVARAFATKAVAALDGFIAERVQLYWNRLLETGGGEAFEGFAARVALETIGHIIGIPASEAYNLVQWTHDSQNYFGRVARRTPGSPNDAAAMAAMLAYFSESLRRALDDPEETVAGNIARLSRDGILSEHETTHLCVMLLLAGSETTALSMLSGLLILAEQPALLPRLAEGEDRITRFVQELIRFRSPAHRLVRIATRDVSLGGVRIPKGAEVRFLPASANRDTARFPEADRFDMDRRAIGPIGFGNGIHACLGMHLARQELRIAFDTVAAATSRITLDRREPVRYLEGGSMGVTGPVSAHFHLEGR